MIISGDASKAAGAAPTDLLVCVGSTASGTPAQVRDAVWRYLAVGLDEIVAAAAALRTLISAAALAGKRRLTAQRFSEWLMGSGWGAV